MPSSTPEKQREYYKKWYAKNKEQQKQRRKDWYHANKDKARAYQREYTKKNPLKRACHLYINAAVKEGLLTRPLHCELCNDSSNKIQAHHENYCTPLHNIKWLCGSCHRQYELIKPSISQI